MRMRKSLTQRKKNEVQIFKEFQRSSFFNISQKQGYPSFRAHLSRYS